MRNGCLADTRDTIKQINRIMDTITVTVKSIRGTQVKLGIEAPEDIVVTREELLDEQTYTSEGQAPK